MEWSVRVGYSGVKWSVFVWFAFELLAAQASFDIIVNSVKHVRHVEVASNCQVSPLGPLMVAKEVVMVLGDDCVSQRFWDS